MPETLDVPASDAPDEAAPGAAAPDSARRLHPLTLLQQVLTSLPAVAVVLFPLLASPGDGEAWLNFLPAVIYGVVVLPVMGLRYLRFRYWITPSEIVIQKGVLKTQHRSIPIERVQNVQVIRSLVPRLLGMAKVKVETAGSGSTEGTLEYVALPEAERIRETVRDFQRKRGVQPGTAEAAPATEADAAETAEEEAGEAAEQEVLYEMPLGRVLLSGMFRFSLALIALIFSALQYTGFDDPDALGHLFRNGPLHALGVAVLASPLVAAVLSVVLISLLGWLTGIALNLNRYYGFRLWRARGKLHYRRGLFTVSEGTIPLEKVQAVILRTNPLMRLFGWFILEVQAMGVEGSNHRTAVPLAKKREVLALARRIHPFRLPEHFAHVSRLTIRRATVRYTLALGALVGAVGIVGGFFVPGFFWREALWGCVAWPLVPAWAFLRYRNLGYALGGEGLFVQRGVVRHRIWLLPTEKQQVFYTTASLFQRRLGLKSLYLDTAGAGGLASPDVVDLPAATADRCLRQCYARFQQHFENGAQRVASSA